VDHAGCKTVPPQEPASFPPIHDDPCDRFIIAAAKLDDLPVVTTDERFEKYGVTVLS